MYVFTHLPHVRVYPPTPLAARAHPDSRSEAAPARASGRSKARGDMPRIGRGGGVGVPPQQAHRAPAVEDLRVAAAGCGSDSYTGVVVR